MTSYTFVTPILSAILFLGLAEAKLSCPTEVSASVEKAYPNAKVSSCKQENEDGKTTYEVKLEKKGARKLVLDVTPEGAILQTEKRIRLRAVPKAVREAFAKKYPTMRMSSAEEQTKADGAITYELGFMDKMKNHEATFASDGVFVEEE